MTRIKKQFDATIRFLFSSLIICSPEVARCNPSGAHSIEGSVSFLQPDSQTLEVHASDKAIINWTDFSIGRGETTKFYLPDSSSTVLNRVTSGKATEIYGNLESNGRIFLINPNGLTFGDKGIIQTAGFIASTLSLSDDQFKKGGDFHFTGASEANITNFSKIEAKHGDVFLIAHQVINHGDIEAPSGMVGIASGQDVLIKPSGKGRIYIRPRLEATDDEGTGIVQTGAISAIEADLRADGNPFKYGIQQKGVIAATGVMERDGVVYLVAENSQLLVEGEISAQSGTETGGEVHLFGEKVSLLDKARVDVSGDLGGGTVLIGGAFQGRSSPHTNANQTYIAKGAEINASAKVVGTGGHVIVWSNEATGFYGNIAAEGGKYGGDGGFAEISGAKYLDYRGLSNMLASYGQTGTILIDPTDITISSGHATSGLNRFTNLISPPEHLNAVTINIDELATQLFMSNVTIKSENNGAAGNGNIVVSSSLKWSSGNSLSLCNESPNGKIIVEPGVKIWNDSIMGASISLSAISDIEIHGSVGSKSAMHPSASTLTLKSTSGNILIFGGDTTYMQNGPITINACNGTVSLIGGALPNQPAIIGSSNGASSGNITINAKNLLLQGGSGSNSLAAITRVGAEANIGSGVSGDINIVVTENVSISGGSGFAADAYIGHGGYGGVPSPNAITGDVTLNIGKELEMVSGARSSAFIGTRSDHNNTQDITLNVGNNIWMHHDPIESGQGVYIGASVPRIPAVRQQNVTITAGKNLIMDARDAGPVTIQPFNHGSGNLGIFLGGDLELIAGMNSKCGVLLYTPNMTTEVLVGGNIRAFNGATADASLPAAIGSNGDIGTVLVKANGNMILGGGNTSECSFNTNCLVSTSGSVVFQANSPLSLGEIFAGRNETCCNTCDNIFSGTPLELDSPAKSASGWGGFGIDTARYIIATPSSPAGVGSLVNPFPFTPYAPGVNSVCIKSIVGGVSILSAPQFADQSGPVDLNLGNGPSQLQLQSKLPLVIDGFANVIMHEILNPPTCCGNFALETTSSEGCVGDIKMSVDQDIIMQAGSVVYSNGRVLMTANRNIDMKAGAQILGGTSVTLVVDNQFPTSPAVGPGAFLMGAGAAIFSGQGCDGGPILIYTARQSQNSTSYSNLNGSSYTPLQPALVDHPPHEFYGVYYPDTSFTPDASFTILYKEKAAPLPPVPPPSPIVAAARPTATFELFVQLNGSSAYCGFHQSGVVIPVQPLADLMPPPRYVMRKTRRHKDDRQYVQSTLKEDGALGHYYLKHRFVGFKNVSYYKDF